MANERSDAAKAIVDVEADKTKKSRSIEKKSL